MLASQGKLDLDTPVEEVVTLPFDAQGATIRQLATMQAGLPRPYDISADLETEVANDLGRTWTISDVLEWVKDLPRVGTVGGPGKYNGTNYQVLSQVIEQVTGKPLATAFRDDLLGPAGLDRMWTQVGEQPQAPLAIAVDPGTGIVDAKSGFLPSKAAASTGNGAAGIAADAPTLARWAYLLYGGRVIDPAVLAPMMTPNWESEWAYGFGSMFDKKATGTLAVGHAGDYMGYSAVHDGLAQHPDGRGHPCPATGNDQRLDRPGLGLRAVQGTRRRRLRAADRRAGAGIETAPAGVMRKPERCGSARAPRRPPSRR